MKLEDLIALVGNLSLGERQYFTRSNDSGTKYMQLYHLLHQYREEADGEDKKMQIVHKVRRAMKNDQAMVNAQNLLGKSLLFALRIQKGGMDNKTTNKEDAIKTLIQEAKILLQRGVFETASNTYEKAIELAEQFEYTALACEALRDFIYLAAQQDSKAYHTDMEKHLARLDRNAWHQKMETDYFTLQYQAMLLFRKARANHSPGVQSSVEAFLTNPLLHSFPEEGTLMSKIYYYNTHAALAGVSGNRVDAKKYYYECVRLWDTQKEDFIGERPRSYIVQISNYLTYCNTLRTFDETFDYFFKRLATAPTPTFDDAAEAFQNRMLIQQQMFLNKWELKSAVALMADIEKGFSAYRGKINKSREISLRFNHIVALFILEEYQEALNYSEKLLEMGRSQHRIDIQFFMKVFRLVLHYELGDDADLDIMVKSTKLVYHYHGELLDYDRIVLYHLSKVITLKLKNDNTANGKQNLQSVFDIFLKAMVEYSQIGPKPIGFNELLLWIRKEASPVPVRLVDLLRQS